jgi:E3 ubiquitin-protein ligase listerin
VRQLAHSLQGQVSTACGKRIVRHLPTVVGSWLAGLYDSDRGVSKAAQDSLDIVFTSSEKLYNLRKAYQQQILEFCQTIIEEETVLTLSDERTTSPDDAESKYARVVASAIGVIGNLLTELSAADISKQQELYELLLGSDKLWELSSYKDPIVQRSVLRFLKVCFAKQPGKC